MGVISMKLVGEGRFTQREIARPRCVMLSERGVNCVTLGYKSTAEIDEALEN